MSLHYHRDLSSIFVQRYSEGSFLLISIFIKNYLFSHFQSTSPSLSICSTSDINWCRSCCLYSPEVSPLMENKIFSNKISWSRQSVKTFLLFSLLTFWFDVYCVWSVSSCQVFVVLLLSFCIRRLLENYYCLLSFHSARRLTSTIRSHNQIIYFAFGCG